MSPIDLTEKAISTIKPELISLLQSGKICSILIKVERSRIASVERAVRIERVSESEIWETSKIKL